MNYGGIMEIGQTITNNFGSSWTIISKIGKKLTIKNPTTSEELTIYESKALLKDFIGKYDKTIRGIGCIGDVTKSFTKKDKSCWSDMIIRCINKERSKKIASYDLVKISEDFLVFANFLDWLHEQNIYKLVSDWQLDKDLFFNGYYSRESCCLLPKEVNLSLVGLRSTRSNTGYTGVTFCRREKVYVAKIHKFGKHYNLGSFKCPEEAYNVWKNAKLSHLQQLAEKYQDVLDRKVYDKLINFDGLVSAVEDYACWE